MISGRLQVPPRVRKGEPFAVRVLVQHPMETGFRRDMDGRAVPLNVVEKLTCTFGNRTVFSAELGTGIAANPYLSFWMTAPESGELVVTFRDDKGDEGRITAKVEVA